MKKLIVLIMAALLVCTIFCGCGKADGDTANTPPDAESQETEIPEVKEPTDDDIKASIVGAWMGGEEGERLGYIFNEDGTGTAAIFPMTYTVKDGIITVTVEGFGQKETASARYSLEGDTLIIETDKGEYVLERTEMPE